MSDAPQLRNDVESLDTRSAVNVLQSHNEDAATALGMLGQVAIALSGYDDDPRNLWEIPEARAWWKSFYEEVPHLIRQPKGPKGHICWL